MVIQTVSRQYATEKAQQKKKVKTFLLKEIEKYNQFLTNELTEQIIRRMQNLEKQLYKIQVEEINGYKIRTRLPDVEKNEPKIDFYSKLEKKKGSVDLIKSLKR